MYFCLSFRCLSLGQLNIPSALYIPSSKPTVYKLCKILYLFSIPLFWFLFLSLYKSLFHPSVSLFLSLSLSRFKYISHQPLTSLFSHNAWSPRVYAPRDTSYLDVLPATSRGQLHTADNSLNQVQGYEILKDNWSTCSLRLT